MDIATEDGILSPLRGRYAKLRLSLYADDAVIFLNPVNEEVAALFKILEQFGNASSLKLNVSKCLVAPIRCLGLDLDQILAPFTGQRVSFPIKYLGLPLTLGRLKLVHVQNIIDKARTKLAGWQGWLLNIAGRRELVRLVLSAIPTYLLSALKVPKQLLKDIDKARRRFLWVGDSEVTGGKCKVAWTLAARPIEFGGLGIIDLEKFSRVLRLRWLWYSWAEPQRAWRGTTMPIDDTDTALFAAATTVTVRNGCKAFFWHSNWAYGQPLSTEFPLLYNREERTKPSKQPCRMVPRSRTLLMA